MRIKRITVINWIVAFLAGGLLPFAFAPFELWPLALISPYILLRIWEKAPPLDAALQGFVYGLGVFGIGVSWVFVSIHHFGNTPVFLAALLTTIFVAILALFPALQGYALKRFFKQPRATLWLIGFPAGWVLFEWLRSWLFTGFPWIYLGYSQLETPLAGFAPILSVYGVSLAVALTCGALFTIVKGSPLLKISSLILLGAMWSGGQILKNQTYTTAGPHPFTVSLIQGNISPLDKFGQNEAAPNTEKTYLALTEPYWGSDLILWPESALPLPLPYAQDFINQLNALAQTKQSTLVTGLQVMNTKSEYYNSLIALGNGHGMYHKHHLVPFGDFLPFENWLRGLIHFFDLPMSSFMSGSKNQSLITAGTLKLEPLICYEIAFPELVRDGLKDADAIITLSEDGWFGDSLGPHQHLQIAQFRALETGRWVLRATTSGITAIIDDKGRISASIPQFQATVLKSTFQAMHGKTPWVKIGLWPLIIVLLLCYIFPVFLKRIRARGFKT